MKLQNPDKVIIAILVTFAISLLCYAGKIDGQATVGVISAVMGYVLGNGHGILEGKAQAAKQAKKDD